jgi:hypothetical protein
MSGRIVGWTDPQFPHECEPPTTGHAEDFAVGTVWQCDCGSTHIVYAAVGEMLGDRYLAWQHERWSARKRRERRDAPRRTTGGYPSGSRPTSELKPPPASISRLKI